MSLVELPKVGLSLTERSGHLYSVDHAELRVCDESYLRSRPELCALTQGIPHCLVLVNTNEEPFVLVRARTSS